VCIGAAVHSTLSFSCVPMCVYLLMPVLQETSQVLSSATERSLVIMDELGRGTSTFDGTAIAYATLFHLVSALQCFTLFVTQYGVVLHGTRVS